MDKSTIIKNSINFMLDMFKSGNFPKEVAMSVIKKHEGDDLPSDNWSLGNRMLMKMQGTDDARGFRQWQQINRNVRKGSKAIFILRPSTKIITEKDKTTGEETTKVVIVGFSPLPVFRFEDTQGASIPKFDYTPKTFPPFFDVAKKLGIDVQYQPLRSNCLGLYNSRYDNITLYSESAITYYHELAHALDNRLNPDFHSFSKERKEIVAEFSAIVLCQLSGFSGYEDQSYHYIKNFCKDSKSDATILKNIMGVLSDVEKIVDKVLAVSADPLENDSNGQNSTLDIGA